MEAIFSDCSNWLLGVVQFRDQFALPFLFLLEPGFNFAPLLDVRFKNHHDFMQFGGAFFYPLFQLLVSRLQFFFILLEGRDLGADADVVVADPAGCRGGHDGGFHPVQLTVFPAVADFPAPGLATADGRPHLGEEGRRVVAGIDDTVFLAHQVFEGILRHFAKFLVGISMAPFSSAMLMMAC